MIAGAVGGLAPDLTGTFNVLRLAAPRMTEEEAQAKWGQLVLSPSAWAARTSTHGSCRIVANDYLNGEVIRIDRAQRFGPK